MRMTRRNISYLLCAATLLLGVIGATITRAAIQYNASDVNMMAIVLYKEIGGYEDPREVQQVANVIMNRYKAWGGKVSIGDILTQRWDNKKGGHTFAFSGVSSYLTESTTNEQILAILNQNSHGKKCLEIANAALAGQLQDLTEGATAYRTCIGGANSEASRTFGGAGTRVDLSGSYQGAHCYYKNYALGGFRDSRYGKTIIAKEQSVSGSGVTYSGNSSATSLGGSSDGGSFASLSFVDDRYEKMCQSAEESGSQESNIQYPADTFSPQILAGMQKMMLQIYASLSQLYIYGNALMCYATNVAYTCVGFETFDMCVIKAPNLSFWLSGGAIYSTAFFMTLAVGMYFVDVTFKIGFAVLFLPISIALWPFKPTSKKLMDNISIILHNAMLFAFVSIGVAFAVALIHSITFNGVIDQNQFAQALADQSGEEMSKNFSIDADVFLLVLFSILVGLKIIQSSVKDYLNKIFPDNVFGSASPMMQKGTQALGFIASRTVMPAANLVKDIAVTQGGKGLQQLGNFMRGNSNPTLAPNIPAGGGQGGGTLPTGSQTPGTSPMGPSAAQATDPLQSVADIAQSAESLQNIDPTQAATALPQGLAPIPAMSAETLATSLVTSAVMGAMKNKEAPISLAPGAIFSDRNVLLQAETYQALGRLAKSIKQKGVVASCQEALSSLSKNPAGKAQNLIMKGSQIFVRSILETAGSAIYSAGRGLESAGPGKNMAPRTNFRGTNPKTQQTQTSQQAQQQPMSQPNQTTPTNSGTSSQQPETSTPNNQENGHQTTVDNNGVIHETYQENGQILSHIQNHADGSKDVEQFHKNGNKRREFHEDANGSVEREYYENGQLKSERVNDSNGNGHYHSFNEDGSENFKNEWKNDSQMAQQISDGIQQNKERYQQILPQQQMNPQDQESSQPDNISSSDNENNESNQEKIEEILNQEDPQSEEDEEPSLEEVDELVRQKAEEERLEEEEERQQQEEEERLRREQQEEEDLQRKQQEEEEEELIRQQAQQEEEERQLQEQQEEEERQQQEEEQQIQTQQEEDISRNQPEE